MFRKPILHVSGTLFLVTLFSTCCSIETAKNVVDLYSLDIVPPEFVSISMNNDVTIEIRLNEKTWLIADSFVINPDIEIVDIIDGSDVVQIVLVRPIAAGESFCLEAIVEDEKGNSSHILHEGYGFNPSIPNVVINEFTTQGSGNHPDIVELYVKNNGNMGGVTFFEGTSVNWEQRFVFPSLEVNTGDYILIHCKPDNIETEINETGSKIDSAGKDAKDTAWDFWIQDGKGLSGNNGVLTLYSNPNGKILDAVAYSNRTSWSDEKYRGFGSTKVRDRVDIIVQEDAWKTAEALARPEDCIDPEDSTATRSICRASSSSDRNEKADWHIVPTSGYSFGSKNTDEVY